MEKKKEEEKKEEKEVKIPHMCESIGHRPHRGRCQKKGKHETEISTRIGNKYVTTRYMYAR